VPFVQGQLLGEETAVSVVTACAHCAKPMHLEIDSTARCSVSEAGADPITFFPEVDFSKMADRCITGVF